MKKPKWRKYKGGWKRGVLGVYWDAFTGRWVATVYGDWIDYCDTPEEAMKAADKWWERTRWKKEASDD